MSGQGGIRLLLFLHQFGNSDHSAAATRGSALHGEGNRERTVCHGRITQRLAATSRILHRAHGRIQGGFNLCFEGLKVACGESVRAGIYRGNTKTRSGETRAGQRAHGTRATDGIIARGKVRWEARRRRGRSEIERRDGRLIAIHDQGYRWIGAADSAGPTDKSGAFGRRGREPHLLAVGECFGRSRAVGCLSDNRFGEVLFTRNIRTTCLAVGDCSAAGSGADQRVAAGQRVTTVPLAYRPSAPGFGFGDMSPLPFPISVTVS